MKLVAFSDTHGKHEGIIIPKCDILIFAGDGEFRCKADLEKFLDWFEDQPAKYHIMIAGNHDFYLQKRHAKNEAMSRDILYLENFGAEVCGLKIWGSPMSPKFGHWAFMKERGDEIAKIWKEIPHDTDIVITHSPALGLLDKGENYTNLGCWDLLQQLGMVKPKIHICGHIHSGYGQVKYGYTNFINCSVLDEQYQIAYKPIEVEI